MNNLNEVINQIKQAAEYNNATTEWLVQRLAQARDENITDPKGRVQVIGYTIVSKSSGSIIKPKIYADKTQAEKAFMGHIRLNHMNSDEYIVLPVYIFTGEKLDGHPVTVPEQHVKKKDDGAITMTPEQIQALANRR